MKFFIFAYWLTEHIKEEKVGLVRVWKISENLFKLGHEVVVFIPKHRHRREASSFKIVEVPFLKQEFIRPLSFQILLFIRVFIYILRFKPDILYLRQMNSIFPLVLSKLFHIPLLIEIHGLPFLNNADKGKFLKQKRFFAELTQRVNFQFCDKLILISKNFQTYLQKRYKIPLSKMTVITSGSDTALFQPRETEECRQLLGLPRDPYYVGFIGTFYAYQGIDILIKAAPFILKKFFNIQFLIVGDGIMRKAWEKQVIDNGLAGKFIFTGQIAYEKAPLYLNAMDVCVEPDLRIRRIFSPVKLFDYFACGKAVVASNVGSIRELVSESGGAVLVEPGDTRQLADAIIRLLGDENQRNRLGANGRRFVVEKASWEKLTKKTVEACREVVVNRACFQNSEQKNV